MIHEALADYGLSEMTGPQNCPEIMAWAMTLGISFPNDETSWCGLAMAAWCTRAGHEPPTGFLGARSWLNWGVQADEPKLGDVTVFWRVAPNSWEGHVALFVTRRGGLIYVLGGNQSNSVSIMAYPVARLLGFRRAY